MNRNMKLSKANAVFYACLAFIFGVASGNFVTVKIPFFWFMLIALGLAWVIIKKSRAVFLLAIFFLVGFCRYQSCLPNFNFDDLSYYNDQAITFYGVIEEVDQRIDHLKLTVHATVNNNSPIRRGKVLIKTPLFPMFNYGDEIEVYCKLREPEPIEDFQYDKYLARYDIYSVCYNAKITILDNNQGNFVIAKLLKLKKFINSIINRTLPEPQASFLAGILLGDKKGLPQNLTDDFNRTGVTHIIAVSGYNISVVATLIMNLCLSLRIHRKRAFYLILIGLFVFVILTGASAAVVRAAIMGVIVLLAKQIGRKSQIRNILAFTAAVMIIINPKILFFDAGFQLSFLATIGLIYFVPIIEKYLQWLPKRLAFRENFTTTMSAIIFTTPLILYQFGRLSIVAPIVNVLILSFIPLAMLLGFIQIIFGALFLPLGRIIGWITWLVLSYIIKIVEIFSAWRFAAIDFQVNLFILALCYIMLLVVILLKNRLKYEQNN